jgi:serine/threonine protein kinase
VQEFVDGQSLEKRIREAGPLSLTDGVDTILQVAEGIRALHANHLLHRDVKPANVLLDSQRQVKVGDFGLLKTLSSQSDITRTRQAMGTIEFGAPELFEDARSADVRCDIYSVATTFYTAVTGLFPFGSGSVRRVLLRKLRDKFIPLRCLMPTAPAELNDLVSRSVRADRDKRPTSIDSFIASLAAIRERLGRSGPTVDHARGPTVSDVKGTGPERRIAARIAVRVPAAFVQFYQNKRTSFTATILDISHGGMCLHANAAIPNNTLLEITAADTGTSYIVQIRWAKPMANDTFLLGASFVSPPQAQEFRAIMPKLCAAMKM